MAAETLIFGLAQHHYAALTEIFGHYPEIEKVLIYGSRAKGQARPSSDFDLAVVAPELSDSRFSALWNELDALPLIFKLDVLHADRLPEGPLRQNILASGLRFFPPPSASGDERSA